MRREEELFKMRIYNSLWYISVLLLLPATLYFYAVNMITSNLPTLRNKRICLLIAHPDDEAMFFSPTVLALTRPGTGNHVSILCLSSGDAEGLGETRKRELINSGLILGLKEEKDVQVIDNPRYGYCDCFELNFVADQCCVGTSRIL